MDSQRFVSFSCDLARATFDAHSLDVLFVKRSSDPLMGSNMKDIVDIHTLKGSPLESLLSSLQGIWCPTLLENASTSDSLPPRIIQLLSELKTSLSSSVRSGQSLQGSDDLANVSDIRTVADESNFWSRLKDDRRSPHKALAKEVDKAFGELMRFADMDRADVATASEAVDLSLDALQDIWSIAAGDDVFPQARMVHLFDCIGRAIFGFVQSQLGGLRIWENSGGGGSANVRNQLQNCVYVCDRWCEVPKYLTAKWSNSSHTWNGRAHDDGLVAALSRRLEQVLGILTLAEELVTILPASERSSFQFEKLFDPLRDVNPVFYNPYTENTWHRAVKEFERLVDPIETAVSARLRKSLTPYLDSAYLLLAELLKYKNLLRRPTVRAAVVSERESLLALLKDKLKQMEMTVDRDDILGNNSDDEANTPGGTGVGFAGGVKVSSPLVVGIVRLRQLGSKAGEVFQASKVLLDDLHAFDKFNVQCESLIQKIKQEENSRFKSWEKDLKQKVRDGDDSVTLQGPLLNWREGVLVVNFPESLVRFLREYRQLDELGFDVPKPSSGKKERTIGDAAVDAERFYRFGILLKKTANFYNSISEQIIDIQDNLLLGSLHSFSNLVSSSAQSRSKSDLTWSKPSECESFVKTLQEAAEKLSGENRSLRKVHEWLTLQMVGLLNVELHRQGELWKSKWRTVKEKMMAVKAKYSEKDASQWVLHWDHQLYKTLEASYQMGLECINESISEIKVELVVVSKFLDFKPPVEQIRQSYYRELKKFVSIPYSFEGFGNAQLFRKMGPRNMKGLVQVYAKAEALIARLQEVLDRYSNWALLAQVDLDAYIENNVKTSDEYVLNFKMLRSKRKDVDKLPDLEKVDCCTISLVPFKSFIDDLLLRTADSLLINLRRSLIEEFKEVDQFLESAGEKLNSKPRTVDEIGEAKKQWKDFDGRKGFVAKFSKNCVEKKKVLLQYAPGTAVDISEVTAKMANLDGEGGRWDDFEVALEAHNDIIEAQKEVLKSHLEEEEVNINMDIQKFSSKWRQLKPTDSKSWDPADIQKVFDSLDDWRKQFADLEARTNKHADSRQAFGMSIPRFDGLDSLHEDIGSTTKSWDMLKQFTLEERKMSDEDWITFTDIYVLQDFAVKWGDELKASFTRGSYDSVAEYIVTKVERIKKSVPALKYCKSDAFKEDHWTELLQGKLQLPKELRVEKLKVEHFLSRLEILMEPGTLSFVKNLQARAMGEVQIREAMQELRAWELSAELMFLSQEESGRAVPLIKEWKDLFLEIGDKQSLLGSLKESPFFKAFADVGLALEAKMTNLDFILHTLNSIQRRWVYLEPIFARGALPSEESRFRRVDEGFKDIMKIVIRDPKLFYLADEQYFPKLSDNLRNMLDQLERCQKALTEFLEAKRSAMPRFYFIGDDDLLEILGQAKNPSVIQSHLKKLFQGIHKVKFDAECKAITAMISSANEVVELESPVQVSEKVEDWLEQLAQEMRATLAALVAQCYNSKTFDWKYPSQVLCLSQAIKFTEDAEAAIEEGGKALIQLRGQLRDTLTEFTSHDLSSEPLLQLKMKSLVFDLVHNVDVVDQLIAKGTKDLKAWQWSKQLRYYFVKGQAMVRMHDAEFEYTYEYQGNSPKLVHTPLTDRCYLTLTQGMRMGFGGNPYGPAGTGKTESVKALASCFGRQVLVFNCDEALERLVIVFFLSIHSNNLSQHFHDSDLHRHCQVRGMGLL